MYILKNAYKNLLRNKGRNILIGIIMLAVISSTAVAIIINTTTNEIINDYKNKFGSEVFIEPNIERVMSKNSETGGMIEIPEVSSNQYIDFARSDYLKETLISARFMTYTGKLKALDQDEKRSNGGMIMNYSSSTVIGDSSDPIEKQNSPNMTVIGNSNLDMLDEFKKGTRNIKEGRIYQDINECVISEEFAKLNNLKVGDTIELDSYYSEEKDNILKMTITGIYTDVTPEQEQNLFKSAMSNRRNEILTSDKTLIEYDNLFKEGESFISINASYYLKDPSLLEKFTEEVRSKGLSDIFDVSTDEHSYNRIVEPVKGLAKVSKTFLIVVLAFGSVLLILLSIIAIRERKYEIGVLRAMGMEKFKVAIGFICETLIIISICLGLGLFVGSVTAKPVSDMMIENQIKATKQSNEINSFSEGSISLMIQEDEEEASSPLEDVDISLSGIAVAQITGIALLLGFISSIIGIFYITKYEPIKILSERN